MSGLRQTLRHPYVLLTLTAMAWAGNTIAGRLAVDNVSPMALTALRWLLSFALMSLFVREDVRQVAGLIRQRPVYFLIMGFSGFTGFNAVYYIAARYTSAINLGIMQSSTPLFVILGVVLLRHSRVSLGQIIGLLIGTIGVFVVASRGHLSALLNLEFNIGDLMLIAISAMYAGYSLGLRQRPEGVSGVAFFAAMALVAAVTSLPLLAWEVAAGRFQAPTLQGWLVIAFVAVFPSLLAQIWYIRGVAALGAARSGFIFNAIPVFAAIMAVLILKEPFGWHHAVGMALVLGGIAWAERNKPT